MNKHPALGLSKAEISAPFATGVWAEKFPPYLTIEQAAELLQVPVGTLYDWSSRGLLKGCARRVGKHLRFDRNRFIHRVFNEDLNA